MDLTLYRILIQHLTPPPDLAVVKEGGLPPEEWPVVLESIQTYRKQVLSFKVTDGQTSVMCKSDVPNLYDRIAATELGTIIHLLGSKVTWSQELKKYIVMVEDFATLKQYDEHLKAIREAEARRQADLADMQQEGLMYAQGEQRTYWND